MMNNKEEEEEEDDDDDDEEEGVSCPVVRSPPYVNLRGKVDTSTF
eukprot:CAMPEP_0180154484 /NCGR_PEP_ID=MMETSP0986-20121125/24202_1 /TAXON_ID=697907 /ORGANISM="non described non described, Strain CCMP2293" /LENGTH=44 /DNA_ID= /DNA_START= /DNA_END= /DNA_ORIENTATION=